MGPRPPTNINTLPILHQHHSHHPSYPPFRTRNSLRHRTTTRCAFASVFIVLFIFTLNEMRCAKYGCASRVGWYGGSGIARVNGSGSGSERWDVQEVVGEGNGDGDGRWEDHDGGKGDEKEGEGGFEGLAEKVMPWYGGGEGTKGDYANEELDAKIGWVDLDGGMPVAGSDSNSNSGNGKGEPKTWEGEDDVVYTGSGVEEHMNWESGGDEGFSFSSPPDVDDIQASVAASVAKPSPANEAPVVDSYASTDSAPMSGTGGKETEKEKDFGNEKGISKEEYAHDESISEPLGPAGLDVKPSPAVERPPSAAQSPSVEHPSSGGKEATKGNAMGDAKSPPAAAGGMADSIDMMGGDGFGMKASGDNMMLGGATGSGGFEGSF